MSFDQVALLLLEEMLIGLIFGAWLKLRLWIEKKQPRKKNRKIFQQYYEDKKKGYENWIEVDTEGYLRKNWYWNMSEEERLKQKNTLKNKKIN